MILKMIKILYYILLHTNAYDSQLFQETFLNRNSKFDLLVHDGPHTLESNSETFFFMSGANSSGHATCDAPGDPGTMRRVCRAREGERSVCAGGCCGGCGAAAAGARRAGLSQRLSVGMRLAASARGDWVTVGHGERRGQRVVWKLRCGRAGLAPGHQRKAGARRNAIARGGE